MLKNVSLLHTKHWQNYVHITYLFNVPQLLEALSFSRPLKLQKI